MKKMMFSLVAVAALTLVSCGSKDGENKEGGLSACDCKKEAEELMKKAAADPSKAEELAKEAEALKEKCKDFKEEDYKECK